MKNKIHSIILNSKDPVNDLDTYFTNKQSERDNAWATIVLIMVFIALVLTVYILNNGK